MQLYFQPKIGRKIRIFRLGRKNIIVIMIYDDDDCYYSSLQRIHA